MKNVKIMNLVLILISLVLFNCKKEQINPMTGSGSNSNNCCNNSTFISIENTADSAKTFRLYGGSTQLESVDDNVDPAFLSGDVFDAVADFGLVQPDGKYIIVGDFTTYNGVAASKIIRLNTDGSIDTDFNYGTGFNSIPDGVALQSDGKIMITGSFTEYQGITANGIIRLNSDGSIDPSFSSGTGFNNGVQAGTGVAIQSDGKIIAIGTFTSYNGTLANRIIRLNSDGSVDPTFVYGTGLNGTPFDVVIRPNGKIIAVGSFTQYKGVAAARIVEINTDGTRSSTFSASAAFTGGGPSPGQCTLQSDGKLIATGSFLFYNGNSSSGVVRINSDGSIDNTFSVGTGFNGYVNSSAIQDDGKITFGGNFSDYNGTAAGFVIRLNSDGSFDPTFDYSAGFNDQTAGVVTQADGKVVIIGDFTEYNGLVANRIIRLNENASANITDSDFVTILVNGGESTVESINAETGANPISICEIKIDTDNKEAYKNLFYKKEKNSTGEINSSSIPLLSKYTAAQKNGVNTVSIDGKELSSSVLDGFNYLEWSVPAGSNVSLTITYCQYNRSNNLTQLRTKKVKKKYVHGAFKYYIN